MITINCSRLAAEHLYKGFKKGIDEGFFEPATSQSPAETQEQQGQGLCFQWGVHAVKFGCSTCLIAMEYGTRYCDVIHQVKKGDMQDFFSRLQERLMNGLERQGQDCSAFYCRQRRSLREINWYQRYQC